MAEAIRAAAVDEIPEGEAIVVPAELTGTGDGIAVFHDGGEFFALDDTCSHEEASLAEGYIEDGEVECPMHAARFCLRSGEVQCMPATADVRSHRVEVRGDEVWVYPGVAAP